LIAVLTLDRMAIEEAGPNPERLAAAIHEQLQHNGGEVPVAAIAEALDIVEIKEAQLKGLEGALIALADRNVGAILVNGASSAGRRRFTLAHELGHFLNLWHRSEDPSGSFACSAGDLATGWREPPVSAPRRLVQEAEANRFAIELLAPTRLMRPYLRGIPDLAQVLALSDKLSLSREAGARRYVELHERPSALVFSAEGVVRYVDRSPAFPFVSCRRGGTLCGLPAPVDDTGLSAHEEGAAQDWLVRAGRDDLVVQTLTQRNGYAITLLALEPAPADDDGGVI
jgi:Zn-dependent peptidase ImmA (M78 family)